MPWRRRRRVPDKRLDWRDPSMPVYREYVVRDPLGSEVERGHEFVRLEAVQAESRVSMKFNTEPTWKHDPSYRWAELAKIEWED